MPISRTGRGTFAGNGASFRGRDAHISNWTKLNRSAMSLVPRETCPPVQRDEARSVGDGPRSEGEMPTCPTGRSSIGRRRASFRRRHARNPTGRGSLAGKRGSFPGGHALISNQTKPDRSETSLVPRETCINLEPHETHSSESSITLGAIAPHLRPNGARSVGDEARSEGAMPQSSTPTGSRAGIALDFESDAPRYRPDEAQSSANKARSGEEVADGFENGLECRSQGPWLRSHAWRMATSCPQKTWLNA
jgi:hypothetical protein